MDRCLGERRLGWLDFSLSNWVNEAFNKVYCDNGIGGQGKSRLDWVWKRFLEKPFGETGEKTTK